jgi:hypothetical protein
MTMDPDLKLQCRCPLPDHCWFPGEGLLARHELYLLDNPPSQSLRPDMVVALVVGGSKADCHPMIGGLEPKVVALMVS